MKDLLVYFFAIVIVSLENALQITHSGTFHSDEVMATAILSAIKPVKLCRTFRVPEDTTAFVYDIGGGRYDHHQRGGNGVRENGVPYSSAGLIWRDFGRQIVSSDEVWQIVDRELIQGIDATDNGVYPAVDFPCKVVNLSNLISAFNPNWDSSDDSDTAFLEAVEFSQGILARTIESAESRCRAKVIVEKAIDESEDKIIVLPRFVPWQNYVLSSKKSEAVDALYIVFPSNRGGFNVQAIPDALGSYGNRKPLPESWRGAPADELQEECGVDDAVFCHPAGFICGASSLKGALAMAQKAVEA